MKQIINKLLKTSLVAVGLMGAITLNAWWCKDCQGEHEGPICPVSGKSQTALNMMAGNLEEGMQDAHDPCLVIERLPDGAPVYEIHRGVYKSIENRNVMKIANQWLYTTIWKNIFVGKANEVSELDFKGTVDKLYDHEGNRIQQIGVLADGCKVFKKPTQRSYIATRAKFVNGNIELAQVEVFNSRFVYASYRGYYKLDDDEGAYFDGQQWIDEKTGEVYPTEQDIPREYVNY
ncbi:MAG: hypothetical protein LBE99_04820 [Puniceicoccales bacterium]|jgi:hypothetical protein|nr:hypothetical protein [Puniceicoccales bacterium]